MQSNGARSHDIRVEVVTSTFVAAGRPERVRDLGRFLENLNNPAISKHIHLEDATVRPLYRAAAPLALDATLLVRRDEIVFANFEGPYVERDVVQTSTVMRPCLLMAPPFQVQGDVAFAPNTDPTQALRALTTGFFVVRGARVFDADGVLLGQGEQIVINGAAVQMAAPTRRHIIAPEVTAAPRADVAPAAAAQASADLTPERQEAARAA
jgi:hypothetical protein